MSISKGTATVFVTTSGASFHALVDAKYREMQDVFLQIFADSGMPVDNNMAANASKILGKRFVDITNVALSGYNTAITTVRSANP